MQRYFPVLNPLGLIILIFSLLMGIPLSVSWLHADNALTAYDESIFITFAFGLLLWAATRNRKRDLRVRDGFLLVVLTWVALPVFAALPLWLYMPDMSFTDAYFEATSGLTATGATVMSGLDSLPISINFWRTFLHWIGGMGVIVLAVAILPLLGIGGRQMFKAENPGPMKESSLTPRIAETAKGLWVVYVLLTVACTASLTAVGMEFWDAMMHAFSIMGLGGFSTKDASLGHFNSVPIELVAMGFALLSGINYATHFMALRQRSTKAYLNDPELPFYFGVLAVSILALSLYLSTFNVYDGFANTVRYVAFHTISLSTSLGFATSDYTFWPMFAQLWILFLGSFIACSGSTGGGIKLMRAIILYKQVFREVVRAIHPSAIKPVRLGKAQISDKILHAVLAFSFIYMVTIVTLTLVLSATGLELITAFSAVIACLNNTGPGLNAVGPASTYAVLTDFQTWVCAFAMLLGRLELFTLIVVLTPAFWRK
ncbi:MAG TPA: potassium transporter TrkG [Denitromonas sp.]|uniref:TrkH family potassium uptake protein n=1 Tax=Denitromonas sp. TaxID=2734609 RepID=UPI002C0DB8EF|nr:TrkH family potassium uptake protein [Zoogloeaceae bacterium]HQU89869.1 potassium transporter TrkG [Denitromonas sp.]HQV15306.1 potassium transporter TrkG [Denitromonas sp.]